MIFSASRYFFILFIVLIFLLVSCSPQSSPFASVQFPGTVDKNKQIPPGFVLADGSRPLTFPEDFGPHEDFQMEWWYYTGNLATTEGRHFGFELTIFRIGLLPSTGVLPRDSKWYGHSIYLAHFAISDIASDRFYAFERYSRPGPGLAGAQASPYQVWLEDWNISEKTFGVYHLQAEQENISLNLTLTDEMGVVLQGDNGFTRGGENPTNTAYYYSQPRLHADGTVGIKDVEYVVGGLAWKDHEFSSGVLDQNQIGWDWFSLQFEDGRALMLYQLRERDGKPSSYSSGTLIASDGTPRTLKITSFEIQVVDTWKSPYTQGIYPSGWEIQLDESNCQLNVQPWMKDQELHFPTVTYWEGAVHFEGTCDGAPVLGNGYIELTGYAGKLPLR
jgi:predicted secreted hydrolase